MSAARDEILKAIRRHLLEAVDLPATDGPWIEYDDAVSQFCEMLSAVGGHAVVVEDAAAADRHLQSLEQYGDAKKVISLIEGLGRSDIDLDAVTDPHELADIDFAIAPARFGVAENGAVWIHGNDLKHRVLPFITQHLALVLPANEVLHNMHQAYERLTFTEAGFGVFVSGPSKTADIEQSLVIGAHGPRSLTVLLIESELS